MALPLLLAASLFGPDSFADLDKDGLLDSWEVHGFGPLDPAIHGCKPGRADMIVCFRITHGMTEETMKAPIERMKRFYAEMPHTNPDGSKGLNLIPVILPPLSEEDSKKGYIEMYDKAFPTEWRGLAHGIMVGNSPGGGGQANRPDWAGTGYNWWTMVHELGHQLGLPHEPMGQGIGSPFHPSLMNYDYSYQLDGDGEKVQFSPGKFASLKMSESAMDEVVPFSAEDLSFLTKRPHFLTVKSLGPKKSAVDWNRNGVLGERRVRANVNDGYSVGLSSNVKSGKVAGAPALAAMGKDLYMVGAIGDSLDSTSPSLEKPAKAALFKVQPKGAVKMCDLDFEWAVGDFSVLAQGSSLTVAASTKEGWTVATYKIHSNGAEKLMARSFTEGSDPALCSTPFGALAVVRDAKSGLLSYVTLDGPDQESKPLGLTSAQAPGVAWNSKKCMLAVATVEDRDKLPGCIVIRELMHARGGWSLVDSITVGGDKSPARTSNRPIVLFDAGKDRGPKGAYNVYCKGWYADKNQPGLNYLCRQIAAGTGWWIKMMGNEWANSRSVCSAAFFDGDIAYGYRWFGGPEDNSVWLSLRASGIDRGTVTDFDEVSFIFERGLRESLIAVRNEQWRKKRG